MNCDNQCVPACGSLPDAEFSTCNPVFNLGQISNIYLTMPGYSFIDETDPNEWAYRLALASGNPSRIINLRVLGDKPAPKDNEVVGAYDKVANSNKIHTLNFTYSQTSDTNWTFMRYLEKYKKALGWYKTVGGKTFGGRCGIMMAIVINGIIPPSSSELENLTGIVTFVTKYHPLRADSVI